MKESERKKVKIRMRENKEFGGIVEGFWLSVLGSWFLSLGSCFYRLSEGFRFEERLLWNFLPNGLQRQPFALIAPLDCARSDKAKAIAESPALRLLKANRFREVSAEGTRHKKAAHLIRNALANSHTENQEPTTIKKGANVNVAP